MDFRFVDDLRKDERFDVQQRGGRLEMVGKKEYKYFM